MMIKDQYAAATEAIVLGPGGSSNVTSVTELYLGGLFGQIVVRGCVRVQGLFVQATPNGNAGIILIESTGIGRTALSQTVRTGHQQEHFDHLNDIQMRQKITELLKSLGYKFVCVDLEGYRMGSYNQTIDTGDVT